MEKQVGAIVEVGPEDWQIVQQDAAGMGRMEFGGRCYFIFSMEAIKKCY